MCVLLHGGMLQLRTHIDPVTGLVCPFTPDGRFVHVPPPVPTLDWATDYDCPWWADPSMVVGRLSQVGERYIRVVNTLSRQEDTIKVGEYPPLQHILLGMSNTCTHGVMATYLSILYSQN